MSKSGPGILVIADDWDQRVRIGELLRDAGFTVETAPAARAPTALGEERFAAAVIALSGHRGIRLAERMLDADASVRALVVADAPVAAAADERVSVIRRPFDPHQLLGCVFELVLRGDLPAAAPHRESAESGIAAAKLACLCSRHAAAAAAGASRVVEDLGRQILQLHSARRGLAIAAGN